MEGYFVLKSYIYIYTYILRALPTYNLSIERSTYL